MILTRAWALVALAAPLLLPLWRHDLAPGPSGATSHSQATPAALVLGETPGAVPVSLLIENLGDAEDRLVGATSPVARRVELHRSRLRDGVWQMEVAREGLLIPAGATIVLEPERDHLMLVGLQEDLIQGQSFPLTLELARAGELTVTVRVRRKVDAAGATPISPVTVGGTSVSLASAPPAPAVAS